MSNQDLNSQHRLMSKEPPTRPSFYPLVSSTGLLPYPAHPHSFSQLFHVIPIMSNDNGICDGMNGCHLTEAWVGSQNPQRTISSSVISPYASFHRPFESQSGFSNGTNHDSTRGIFPRINEFKQTELEAYPQQQPILDGLMRFSVLHNETSSGFDLINKISAESFTDMNQFNKNGFEVKTKIKYQDHELSESIHRDDIRSSNGATSISMTSPPKKKWIRHYLTGKVMFHLSSTSLSLPFRFHPQYFSFTLHNMWHKSLWLGNQLQLLWTENTEREKFFFA